MFLNHIIWEGSHRLPTVLGPISFYNPLSLINSTHMHMSIKPSGVWQPIPYATFLRKNDSGSHQLPVAPQHRTEPQEPFPKPWWNVDWFDFVFSNCGSCELMSAMTMPSSEVSISQHPPILQFLYLIYPIIHSDPWALETWNRRQ